MTRRLYLASRSPRRADLLRQIGVTFQTIDVDINENWLPGEPLARYVARLASEKAAAAKATLPTGSVVLAADTAGDCQGKPLVKPASQEEAIRMLQWMSGKSHTVATGISLCLDGEQFTEVVSTQVFFRPITETECRHYWSTGEPCDKAGSYAIQGFGAIFVERIEGSYSGVVGLPLAETANLLARAGIPVWQDQTIWPA